ncbi:hypothetical protein AU468_07105 [Alkalispirochaeta sphaeroplastigenens]|uniref:ABC transmembrane type-1 domain-containing protein n=1 Tax=Alkalispirochaeta sphaeroplastigenens TaxID=1187066 RepID=A0A2S4JR70_9SPIO|nr:ABC transporter permease subunit [Alkalispirochaeta sphaeroplastigenens]POR02015.1 hypothetical protein AU468_07105 [Alkalispirochaeta sphaeroplastigenens]
MTPDPSPWPPRIIAWAVVLAALPLWEVLRRLGGVSPLLMPPLREIAVALLEALRGGALAEQVLTSLGFILAGAAIALVLALTAVLLSASLRSVAVIMRILGALLHPLPGIVLLPVIVLWAGIGPAAVLVVIVHSVFWPVLTNLQAGYSAIPLTWRLVARNYRLGGLGYLVRIALPATAPYLLAGLRIAWARAWRALISAEMLFGSVSGSGGLGWFIHSRRVFMDTAGLFAGIVTVMAVGSLVETVVFRVAEDRTIRRWGMTL